MREIAVIILLFVVSLCQATEPNLVARYDCNSIIYTVSGTLSPDATGVYVIAGMNNMSPYFYCAANGYYIWYSEDEGTYCWYVSLALNVPGTAYWKTADESLGGGEYCRSNYTPGGTATGTLTFTAVIPDEQGYSDGTHRRWDDVNLNTRLVPNGLLLTGDANDYVNLNKSFTNTFRAYQANGFTVNLFFTILTVGSEPFLGVSSGDFSTGLGGFYFGLNDIGGLLVRYKTSGQTAIQKTDTEYGISVGPKYMASCVFKKLSSSQTNVSLYLNGVLKFTQTYSVNMSLLNIDNLYCLWLGQYNFSGDLQCYFLGTLADVRLYNKALTAQEIAILYLNKLLGSGNYLDPANVRYNTLYEVNDVNLTGTLVVPSLADVRYGVDFNDSNSTSGILNLPGVNDVRYGIQFDNNTKSGLLDLPDVNKVSQGTKFDSETKTGTYKDKRRMRIF